MEPLGLSLLLEGRKNTQVDSTLAPLIYSLPLPRLLLPGLAEALKLV